MSTSQTQLSKAVISVAMCTYNGQRFLKQQLDSIAAQTRQPDEMVICDDQSNDQTAKIVEQFAADISFPVRFVRNEKRLRFAANFAKCMALCSGDIVVLTDQDDLWMPNRVEITASAFRANPSLTFTFSDAPLINEEGELTGRTIFSGLQYPLRDMKILMKGEALFPFLIRYAGLLGCTMAVRRDLLDVVLPLPEPWPHDTWTGLVLSSLGPSLRTEPVTLYRQHANQYVGAEMQDRMTRFKEIFSRDVQQEWLEMQHTENAIGAAMKHPELHVVLLQALNERLDFLKTRYAMKQVGRREVGTWLRLVLGREYAHHGAGMRTAAKDLAILLRGSNYKSLLEP